jgi:hypothetical protein
MTTMGATNTDLEQARALYFSLGGLESDLGPRDDPNWYWRRAAKMAHAELQHLKAPSKAAIPDDVERFIAECEARVSKATPGPWLSNVLHVGMRYFSTGPSYCVDASTSATALVAVRLDADFVSNAREDVPHLIAIVRAQGSWITELKAERAAMREHIAKLEELLERARKHWGPYASSPACDCDGCTILRDIAALLPDATQKVGPK